METHEVQQQLFSYLKDILPPHLSLVDELCDLLDLSADSAYRRIRGEKPITISELKQICQHYHLSIDQMLQLQNESVVFNAPGLNSPPGEFIDQLKRMLAQFKYFNSFKTRECQFLGKELPLWAFYLFPEISAFKTFFWSKSVNNHPGLTNKLFSMKEFSYDDCFAIGQKVLEEYNQINSVELWNLTSVTSTINQIAFYRDAGYFKSAADFDAVVFSFQQMLDHFQLQAEKGVKFMPGANDVSYKAPIQYYVNELIVGNNSFVFNLDNKKLSVVTYNVFHYLITSDLRFVSKSEEAFNTIINRSTLISKTGEKDRNRFFNSLRNRVNELKK